MDINDSNDAPLDPEQSLKVINQMIQTSQQKIRNDGMLFIIWGWTMFLQYLLSFLKARIVMTYQAGEVIQYAGPVMIGIAVIYTIYYIARQRRRVQTYIGISLRYVWIAMFVSLVLINLIQFNVLHKINFELQHPVFMVVIAFAIVVSGGILRYPLLVTGGVIFGLMAYLCSYLSLQNQILLEAIAWLIAFIIPGHILFARRNKQEEYV